MIIGRCIGETSLIEVTFISDKMPKVGEYVCLRYDGKTILGMIETMARGNVALNGEIYSPDTVEMITKIEGDEYLEDIKKIPYKEFVWNSEKNHPEFKYPEGTEFYVHKSLFFNRRRFEYIIIFKYLKMKIIYLPILKQQEKKF